MHIQLPNKFEKLLKGEYRAFVDLAVARYNDIYTDNKMEFFQDYTNHGLDHIQEVLETAENIIDDESFAYLNEKDICVLIISVILHDVGMHISKEGLQKIFQLEYDKWRVREFDKKSWKEEWVDYYREAKRFNDEQLKNIFGTSSQIIAEPNLDVLDDYTRKIYGEFLRRFHHRLAHEIALGGFPTQVDTENIYLYAEGIERDLVDLAGLVARSHGLPIRRAADYLETRYQDAWRAPYDVKVIFLMVVLRISDYLQIHSGRASKVLLKSKKFSSPISKMEWEKHNSIKDINIRTADPERIFVIAKPESSTIYLELEKLFKDIQSELDVSWAILGEAYGKDEDLNKLKIRFRRIRSVLDDREAFQTSINYIPEKIFFNADPALLKLLIGPLYGEDPKYGVRELLQNSIDAITEREYLNGTKGGVSISLQAVKKDKPRYELVISDSGVGMSKDTIINYFFKAGASFRKSMDWKKNFLEDNQVKIQRTGRFGVGVLAVFLLGDEFEMWTKYDSNDAEGYYCKASLGITQVELVKQPCNVGTTIKIPLKDSANSLINSKLQEISNIEKDEAFAEEPELLEWFTWYFMERPEITYSVSEVLKEAFTFTQKNLLVSNDPEHVTENWRGFKAKDYRSVHWVLDLDEVPDYMFPEIQDFDKQSNHHNRLICNGFKIYRGYQITDPNYNWRVPKVSIFDNNGHLPLSLNRDYLLDDKLPFEDELLENMALDVISAILKTQFDRIGPYYIPRPNYLKYIGQIDVSEFIVVIGDEFTILNNTIFKLLGIPTLIQLWVMEQRKGSYDYNLIPKSSYQASAIATDTINFYKLNLERPSYYTGKTHHWFNLGPSADGIRQEDFSRKYISTSKLQFLMQGKRLTKFFKENLGTKTINKTWTEIKSRSTAPAKPTFDIKKISNKVYPLIIERHITPQDTQDFFIKTWEKYLGNELTFPVDVHKRPNLIMQKLE